LINELSALKHKDPGKTRHGSTGLRVIVNKKNEGGILCNPLEFLALQVFSSLELATQQEVVRERRGVLVEPGGRAVPEGIRPRRNRHTFVDSSTFEQTAHDTMRMRMVRPRLAYKEGAAETAWKPRDHQSAMDCCI